MELQRILLLFSEKESEVTNSSRRVRGAPRETGVRLRESQTATYRNPRADPRATEAARRDRSLR